VNIGGGFAGVGPLPGPCRTPVHTPVYGAARASYCLAWRRRDALVEEFVAQAVELNTHYLAGTNRTPT